MFFLVCDGLKGLPDSATAVFPRTTVQTCIIHLIRNTFRYASRKYWDQISHDLKPVYTAPAGTRPSTNWTCSWTSGAGPTRRSSGCGVTPGKSSPRSWPIRDVEIRRVLFSTNAIVILSQLQGVVDVADGLDRSPIVRAGRAYLQPSSRHGRGRFGVRCSSGGVRLAA